MNGFDLSNEFSVSKETDIMLKACSMWDSVGSDASVEEIELSAKTYGITYRQAMKYKRKWENISK